MNFDEYPHQQYQMIAQVLQQQNGKLSLYKTLNHMAKALLHCMFGWHYWKTTHVKRGKASIPDTTGQCIWRGIASSAAGDNKHVEIDDRNVVRGEIKKCEVCGKRYIEVVMKVNDSLQAVTDVDADDADRWTKIHLEMQTMRMVVAQCIGAYW